MNTKGISSYTLKIIAILGMTSNHAGNIFYDHLPIEVVSFLFIFGGLTFPIMAFLIVEGYRHTSNVKKYAFRLAVFSVIAQVPYWLFLYHQINVLFTLFLGLVVLYCYDHMKSRALFWLVFVVIAGASVFCDWGLIGVIMILLSYVLQGRRERVAVPALIAIASLGLPQLMSLVATGDLQYLPGTLYALIGCTATIPLLLSYNGKRGKPMKYFFYIYYPAHILILGLIKGFLLNDWTL